MIGARRNSQEKAVKSLAAFAEVAGSSRAERRRNLGEKLIVICVGLLENADIAFTPGNVDTFSARIVIDIIRVLNAREFGDGATDVGIEDGKAGRLVGGHHYAMLRFVEGHGEVVP